MSYLYSTQRGRVQLQKFDQKFFWIQSCYAKTRYPAWRSLQIVGDSKLLYNQRDGVDQETFRHGLTCTYQLFSSHVIVVSTLMLTLCLCYTCIVEQISLRFCSKVSTMDDLYMNQVIVLQWNMESILFMVSEVACYMTMQYPMLKPLQIVDHNKLPYIKQCNSVGSFQGRLMFC